MKERGLKETNGGQGAGLCVERKVVVQRSTARSKEDDKHLTTKTNRNNRKNHIPISNNQL